MRKHRYKIVTAIFLAIGTIFGTAMIWDHEVAGNGLVRFYARVTDELGQPIKGAVVTLRLSKHDFLSAPVPLLRGPQGTLHFFKIATNENGDVDFINFRGAVLNVMDIQKSGYKNSLGLDGIPSAFSYNGQRNMPDAPSSESKRIVYVLKQENPDLKK